MGNHNLLVLVVLGIESLPSCWRSWSYHCCHCFDWPAVDPTWQSARSLDFEGSAVAVVAERTGVRACSFVASAGYCPDLALAGAQMLASADAGNSAAGVALLEQQPVCYQRPGRTDKWLQLLRMVLKLLHRWPLGDSASTS